MRLSYSVELLSVAEIPLGAFSKVPGGSTCDNPGQTDMVGVGKKGYAVARNYNYAILLRYDKRLGNKQ